MREDMSTMVCVKEEEDPGEKLSQDEIISRTKQVIQGLEALKQEHHSILEGLLGTLRCLKQDEEGVLVEEKSHMIRKSLEMLELGLSEAQVRVFAADWWIVVSWNVRLNKETKKDEYCILPENKNELSMHISTEEAKQGNAE